jgi:hypothetical protein
MVVANRLPVPSFGSAGESLTIFATIAWAIDAKGLSGPLEIDIEFGH